VVEVVFDCLMVVIAGICFVNNQADLRILLEIFLYVQDDSFAP
jgi:hypothetical protein